MTQFYSLRSTPARGEYTILKFDQDFNVEAIYALNTQTCTCPAGVRPLCKHRKMLPMFVPTHVDDGWFLDWDTRLWRGPVADAPAQLADPEVLAQQIAPSFATEGSATVLSKRSAESSAQSEPAPTQVSPPPPPVVEPAKGSSVAAPQGGGGPIKRRRI